MQVHSPLDSESSSLLSCSICGHSLISSDVVDFLSSYKAVVLLSMASYPLVPSDPKCILGTNLGCDEQDNCETIILFSASLNQSINVILNFIVLTIYNI